MTESISAVLGVPRTIKIKTGEPVFNDLSEAIAYNIALKWDERIQTTCRGIYLDDACDGELETDVEVLGSFTLDEQVYYRVNFQLRYETRSKQFWCSQRQNVIGTTSTLPTSR